MGDITRADDALMTTFGRLVEAHTQVGRQLGRSLERQAGLPLAWFEVLLRISRADGAQISMGALAQQVALTSGGITRLVDRLIDSGLIERIPCPTDRRVSFAALTARGKDKLKQASAVHAADLRRVFRGFTRAELRDLDDLLDRVRDAEIG